MYYSFFPAQICWALMCQEMLKVLTPVLGVRYAEKHRTDNVNESPKIYKIILIYWVSIIVPLECPELKKKQTCSSSRIHKM